MIKLKMFVGGGYQSDVEALEKKTNKWIESQGDEIRIVNITTNCGGGSSRWTLITIHYEPRPRE